MQEFCFTDCIEIRQLLGKRADDELQLMELIEEVPLDSIYFHMHSCFLRHRAIATPYPNDFANWVAVQVRDKALGGKLSCITPSHTNNLEEVRAELIDTIDNHFSSIGIVPKIVYGQPFYFMTSRIIEVPTNLRANNLHEFVEALKVVDVSAIYNHTFEARFRVKKGKSDFAIWFDEVLGLKQLAEKVRKIDVYMYSLTGLKEKIISLCQEAIEGKIH